MVYKSHVLCSRLRCGTKLDSNSYIIVIFNVFNLFFFLSEDRCPPVPSITNAIPNDDSAENGSIIGYSCSLGNMWPDRSKVQFARCQDGGWSNGDYSECIG